MFLPVLATLSGAVLLWRTVSARRLERATAVRLRTGADGIVPGAATIDLRADGAAYGALLLHGFGDSPHSLRYLAHDLHALGYGVLAPLLPGHGRTLRAFAASRGEQWVAAARDGLAELRARHERVAVVGLSMGGALAATICAGDADVPALVLLAPYLDAPPALRRVATARHLVSAGFVYFAATDPRSIHDPAERARSLGYQTATPRLVHELVGVADRGRAALARVTAPTLLVQSREDSRLSPAVAEQAFHSLGTADKRLVWLEGCGHVITVDFGRERVARLVEEWLQRTIG